MAADALMPISVVIERRAVNHAWQDHVWRPLGILPRIAAESGQVAPGQVLARGDGFTQFYGGPLDLELFRGETEGYLENLAQPVPVVFVVLRGNDAAETGATAEAMEYVPFLATACPYEAMAYGGSGDEIVEGVPMPPDVLAWIRAFVARHHVEVPFTKRKNKPHEDDYGGKRRRAREQSPTHEEEEFW